MSQYSPGMIQRISHRQFYLSTNQPTYAGPGVILEGILFRAPFGLPRYRTSQSRSMSANTEDDILRVFFVGNFFVADRYTSETSLIASIYLFAFFR